MTDELDDTSLARIIDERAGEVPVPVSVDDAEPAASDPTGIISGIRSDAPPMA
jgi:hypothetical protein